MKKGRAGKLSLLPGRQSRGITRGRIDAPFHITQLIGLDGPGLPHSWRRHEHELHFHSH